MTDVGISEATNKVSVEDAGPCRKRINVEVPAEVVDSKLGDSIDALVHEAAVPGFRKGHAPRRLIERRFGGAVREETKRQLMSSAYAEAVEANGLKVIGEPTSEGFTESEIEEGQPYTFSVEVEVMPDFELPKLEGVKILKPAAEVPAGLIDEEIERLCINEGSLEEEETPSEGDYLTGRGVMKGQVKGEERVFHDIQGAVVRVPEEKDNGKGMILGVMVDDFAKQLGKPKAGETATIKVKGPESHEVEDIRGTDLEITFEVERIDRIIPAPLTDVIAKYGLDSEEQLRQGIEARVQERAIEQQHVVMRQQVAKYLVESTQFDLPQRLTAQQAYRNFERRRMELMARGATQQQIEEHIAELRQASGADAARELKLFFIMNKAAEALSVGIDEAEVNGRIAQMAAERGERPEKLRQELISTGRVNALVQQVREQKTMDTILAQAEIEEMSGDEFNKRMREDAEKKGGSASKSKSSKPKKE
ncbi:MAG: trigger factor [Phycisphaerales bacterium]